MVPGVFCSTPIGTDSDIIIKAQIPKTLGVCLPVEHFKTLKDDFDPLGLPSQLTRYVGGIRDEVIYQIGLSIISAMTDKSAAGRMFVETASTTLAARLLQKYCDGGSRQTVEPATDRVDSARMRRALDYISANIEKELTLTQLAQVAGMNVFHFAHTFSRSIGVSPGRYICRKRVEGAMADIAGGKLSLAEISLNAGFSSQASFTRAFHRVTGLTPGEYRAHQR
jgi:AraC family transcriptional regulator